MSVPTPVTDSDQSHAHAPSSGLTDSSLSQLQPTVQQAIPATMDLSTGLQLVDTVCDFG